MNALAMVLKDLRDVRNALQAVEYDYRGLCPECEWGKWHGHREDCTVKAALAKANALVAQAEAEHARTTVALDTTLDEVVGAVMDEERRRIASRTSENGTRGA